MKKNHLLLLYAISAIAVAAIFFVGPIYQNPDYHGFADSTSWLGIPNFWNVVTNGAFVIGGIIGLKSVSSIESNPLKPGFYCFFLGIVLTGFGSGYYHWHPDNTTLIWDRLPMTISFMSFLSIIVGVFIDANAGKRLLYWLIAMGILSIGIWILSGDLRMYVLVQFLPIALVLMILTLSNAAAGYKKYFWLIVLFYAVAKVLEHCDSAIYNHSAKTVSGHPLKHLAAAAAPFLLNMFLKRKFKPQH